MIVMPVKSNNENSAISPVFGKVKFFAIVNENLEITFVENVEKSGIKAVELLVQNGAKTLLMSHIGEKPFQTAKEKSLEVFFVGKERVTIKEAVEKFKNGEYKNASEIDKNLFIGHGSGDHSHNHHH